MKNVVALEKMVINPVQFWCWPMGIESNMQVLILSITSKEKCIAVLVLTIYLEFVVVSTIMLEPLTCTPAMHKLCSLSLFWVFLAASFVVLSSSLRFHPLTR